MSTNPSTIPTRTTNPSLLRTTHLAIPPQLNFIMQSIKTIVTTQLTTDNHPIRKSQILKLFTADGFKDYLDGSIPCPAPPTENDPHSSSDYSLWLLIDQNLAAALYFTISSSLLSYILTLHTCKDIWSTIEHRLQSSNRSRIIQLKHDLDNFSMQHLTMTQFLTVIKSKVDAITSAGVHLDPEDIIHHTLNGLPLSYQIFKTTIRTNLQPLCLDDFYSLICSEESNIAMNTRHELQQNPSINSPTALYANSSWGRGRFTSSNRGRPNIPPSNRSNTGQQRGPPVTCQICRKSGHSTFKCWHRGNLSYQPP